MTSPDGGSLFPARAGNKKRELLSIEAPLMAVALGGYAVFSPQCALAASVVAVFALLAGYGLLSLASTVVRDVRAWRNCLPLRLCETA